MLDCKLTAYLHFSPMHLILTLHEMVGNLALRSLQWSDIFNYDYKFFFLFFFFIQTMKMSAYKNSEVGFRFSIKEEN